MDKMILMVKGHEMWLEKAKSKDNEVKIGLYYGHMMETDGCPEAAKIAPSVYAPDGGKVEAALKAKKDALEIKFKADQPGAYTIMADLSPVVYSNTKKEGFKTGSKKMYKDAVYAGAWHQMAKAVVTVGENGKYKARHLAGILDIVPKEAIAKVGKPLELTVFYDGKKLAGAEVKAISKKEGKETAAPLTGKDGVAKVPITADGKWMLMVRHRDESKGVKDEFDEMVFVTTYTLEATK
jgi:uncharacterized GH25 family protein